MEDLVKIALPAFTTLFVTIDPFGAVPVFIGLTEGGDFAYKRRMAVKSVSIGLVILFFFALAGDWLFKTLGIEMPSFRICGGIMLFLIALEMVFEKRNQRRSENATHVAESFPLEDVSVFPLAIPLLSGPGAITSLILLMGNHDGDTGAQVIVFSVLVAVLLICLVLFVLSGHITRVFGDTLTNILSRLFGIILAALSVQFIMDGIRNAFGI